MVTFNSQQSSILRFYLDHLDEYRALDTLSKAAVRRYLDGYVSWESIPQKSRDFLATAAVVLKGVR